MYAAISITNSTPFPPCKCSRMVMVVVVVMLLYYLGWWLVFRLMVGSREEEALPVCCTDTDMLIIVIPRTSNVERMDLACLSLAPPAESFYCTFLHFFATTTTTTNQQQKLNAKRASVARRKRGSSCLCFWRRNFQFLCEKLPSSCVQNSKWPF